MWLLAATACKDAAGCSEASAGAASTRLPATESAGAGGAAARAPWTRPSGTGAASARTPEIEPWQIEPLRAGTVTFSGAAEELKRRKPAFAELGQCSDGKRFLRESEMCVEPCSRTRLFSGEKLVGVVTHEFLTTKYEGTPASVKCEPVARQPLYPPADRRADTLPATKPIYCTPDHCPGAI